MAYTHYNICSGNMWACSFLFFRELRGTRKSEYKIGNSVRITSGFQEYVNIYILSGHLPPHNVTQPLKTDTLAPKNPSARVVVVVICEPHRCIQVSSTVSGHDVSLVYRVQRAGRCAYSKCIYRKGHMCVRLVHAQPIIPFICES